MFIKVIGEDWKGFNAACYKKENQVENIGLPKVGVKLPDVALNSEFDSESDPKSNCEIRTLGCLRVGLVRRSIASPLRASTMRRR